MKRFFDIILCSIALLVLLPLFAIISIILLFFRQNPFFIQKRVGKNGHLFKVIKFTTMRQTSKELEIADLTTHKDPRIFSFGNFLRKIKIDELPQIINVIMGDMSIIGPRPMTPNIYKMYDDSEKECILKMKPGLSGISSIFFRNEEIIIAKSEMNSADCYRNYIVPYKSELEKWYYDNKTLLLDAKLIFLTILTIFYIPLNNSFWFPSIPDPPNLIRVCKKKKMQKAKTI